MIEVAITWAEELESPPFYHRLPKAECVSCLQACARNCGLIGRISCLTECWSFARFSVERRIRRVLGDFRAIARRLLAEFEFAMGKAGNVLGAAPDPFDNRTNA